MYSKPFCALCFCTLLLTLGVTICLLLDVRRTQEKTLTRLEDVSYAQLHRLGRMETNQKDAMTMLHHLSAPKTAFAAPAARGRVDYTWEVISANGAPLHVILHQSGNSAKPLMEVP